MRGPTSTAVSTSPQDGATSPMLNTTSSGPRQGGGRVRARSDPFPPSGSGRNAPGWSPAAKEEASARRVVGSTPDGPPPWRGPGRLEPVGLVDDVAERLTGEEAPAVVEQDLEAPVIQEGTVPGGVRRDEDARRRPQRMVGRQRLLLEDVEPGAGDLPSPERRHQIIEPRRHAAPDVDEERRALHPLEPR